MSSIDTSAVSRKPDVLIIGAGPAGLTAARQLDEAGVEPMVIEKDDIVGDLSRTVSYNGYSFDIGGHRFFTKINRVEQFWHDVLNDDLLYRSRSSRILYNGKFFNYPLRVLNAVFGLGIWVSCCVLLSYVYAHVFPVEDERTFEDWMVNRFGWRLYNIFFKTYTEKVWGTPCNQISAEWAAQRIKGLSLKTALLNALLGNRARSKKDAIKTLTDAFHYPKRGPGMMWERVAGDLEGNGHKIFTKTDVTKIRWSGDAVTAIEVDGDGVRQTLTATHFISTMPIRELVGKLEPPAPADIKEAADLLKYRDFLTVAVVVEQPDIFPDNWIYIHDDSVKVGRIQNFKNWSPYMVPDPSKSCLGLEYFCFEGDGLWTMSDEDLVELAKRELDVLGLVQSHEITDGTAVRMPKAYPVYDDGYREAVERVVQFLSNLTNLQLVGRNGMHKYNNQDHSMLTAMLAVENILGAHHDLWAVNVEQDYHEELTEAEVERSEESAALASTQPLVPEVIDTPAALDAAIAKTFARLDKAALAGAVGTVSGALLLLTTIWTTIVGEPHAVAHLQLLDRYFYGYAVTYKGATIGFAYAFLWGFMLGWLFAYIRNLALGLYVSLIAHRARSFSVDRVLEFI